MSSFPYKKLYIKNDKEMFKKLCKYNYKSRIVNKSYVLKNIDMYSDFLKFCGKPVLLLSDKSDYLNFNILSDMFNEHCRMKCVVYGQNKSPYDYYLDNKVMLNNMDLYDAREYIYNNIKECSSHRPTNIMALTQIFKINSVLDFSSGWGDRLLGALASNIVYHGVDPNSCLYKGYEKMIEMFAKDKSKYQIHKTRIEDLDLDMKFDMVYTSPPYFNLEIYDKNDKKQSSNYYSEDSWFKNFLKIAVDKSWSLLNDNGYFCININQLNKKQKYIFKMHKYINSLKNSKYLGVISYSNKKLVNPQPIWIWKKIEKKNV